MMGFASAERRPGIQSKRPCVLDSRLRGNDKWVRMKKLNQLQAQVAEAPFELAMEADELRRLNRERRA